MADEHKPKGKQVNLEISEEIAEGVYSNLAIISNNQSEFVIDFLRVIHNIPKAKVKSRILITPQHAKRLLKALHDNVTKYEKQFGVIEDRQVQNFPPMNFTPTAKA